MKNKKEKRKTEADQITRNLEFEVTFHNIHSFGDMFILSTQHIHLSSQQMALTLHTRQRRLQTLDRLLAKLLVTMYCTQVLF